MEAVDAPEEIRKFREERASIDHLKALIDWQTQALPVQAADKNQLDLFEGKYSQGEARLPQRAG